MVEEAMRSSTESEEASEVVPKTARPSAPSSSSQRQWRRRRSGSGERSSRKGVIAGTNRRWGRVMAGPRSARGGQRDGERRDRHDLVVARPAAVLQHGERAVAIEHGDGGVPGAGPVDHAEGAGQAKARARGSGVAVPGGHHGDEVARDVERQEGLGRVGVRSIWPSTSGVQAAATRLMWNWSARPGTGGSQSV
jgi:hypothetical protein